MRTARTLGRLIWYHVPPALTPHTPAETASGHLDRSVKELTAVMAEKRMALDLVDGYVYRVLISAQLTVPISQFCGGFEASYPRYARL